MLSTRLAVTLATLATLGAAVGCAAPSADPPAPATSLEIDADVCDWWEPGDLSVTAADAIVTPHGIAVACEQPGATAHSLLLFDPATHAKRAVYGTLPIEVRALELADADTLLLVGRTQQLFVVDLTASAPTPRRILDYSGGDRWVFEPRIIGDEVYFATSRYLGADAVHTVEKVDLRGGLDQQPVLVSALPSLMMYVVPSSAGLDLFGGNEGEREVARLDVSATPATLATLLQRPRGPYEPMGFHGEVADRVLWQDGANLVQLGAGGLTTLAPMACALDFRARVVGDEIVQVGAISSDPCPGFVAMNAVTGAVRRGPLDARFGGSYHVIGIVGDTVYAWDTDIDTTRILTSPLTPDTN